MDTTRKPRLFIASSVESLETAHAIQENLEYAAEVTVWSQGVFNLTRTTLTTLLETIGSYDFAVFVFAPDDISKIKSETVHVTRDNVVFELGLFMGELREDRTFIVMPRGVELHLPTDIIGITPATYDPDRSDKNLVAALGPASTKINRAMSAAGNRATVSSHSQAISAPVTAGLSEELRLELGRMLKDQEKNIEEAFGRFEKRLTDIRSAQDQTNKAPISSLTNIIKQLTPEAKSLVLNIQKGHITLEQYQLLTKSTIKAAVEELREKNLLVPLLGMDKNKKRIPVFWFPPGLPKHILSIVKEDPSVDRSADEIVKKELSDTGYEI